MSLEINKIHQGDCMDLMSQMPDKSVDIVIVDPPYGMDFQSNYRFKKHDKIEGDTLAFPFVAIDECKRIAKRAVYVFCRWDNLLLEMPKPKSVLAWVKNNWSMGDLKHEHGRQWEAIAFYPLEEHEFIKRIPDVIYSDRTGNELHPTQKPVELIEKLIMANVGQVIFDPYCGSGTTCVAAQNLHRDFIGIEISPKYVEIARDRLRRVPLL